MSDKVIADDDGFVTFQYGESKTTVDLYRVHNKLIHMREKFEDRGETDEDVTDAENQALAEYLSSLGFGDISHRMALRIAAAVHAAVEDLKKKEPSPESPSTNAA